MKRKMFEKSEKPLKEDELNVVLYNWTKLPDPTEEDTKKNAAFCLACDNAGLEEIITSAEQDDGHTGMFLATQDVIDEILNEPTSELKEDDVLVFDKQGNLLKGEVKVDGFEDDIVNTIKDEFSDEEESDDDEEEDSEDEEEDSDDDEKDESEDDDEDDDSEDDDEEKDSDDDEDDESEDDDEEEKSDDDEDDESEDDEEDSLALDVDLDVKDFSDIPLNEEEDFDFDDLDDLSECGSLDLNGCGSHKRVRKPSLSESDEMWDDEWEEDDLLDDLSECGSLDLNGCGSHKRVRKPSLSENDEMWDDEWEDELDDDEWEDLW